MRRYIVEKRSQSREEGIGMRRREMATSDMEQEEKLICLRSKIQNSWHDISGVQVFCVDLVLFKLGQRREEGMVKW